MYDYFRTHVNAFEQDSVSVNEITKYLDERLGHKFERKSVYSDISRLNEYIGMTSKVIGSDSWIVPEGKRYRRNQLEDEITIDEARLIVDAISTTDFVETELCEKIKRMFPTYFSENYRKRALYPHYAKVNRRSISWLNNIRTAIENKQSLSISYGYKLGSELTERSTKIVSPMALDWANNCYYMIAIDNYEGRKLERDGTLTAALKRYRVDRIASVKFAVESYVDYKSESIREEELKRFVENSLSAFSSNETITVELVIKGKTRKDTLKAYNALASRLHNNILVSDDTKLDKGILKITVRTGHAPTLFTDLFELATFEDVETEINNDDICREYADFIKKAAKAAKLDSL